MQPWYKVVHEILDMLADESSHLGKEAILTDAFNSSIFVRVVQYAYDPFKLFGVLPDMPHRSADYSVAPDHEAFFAFLDRLVNKQIGNPSQQVAICIMDWPYEMADILWRILNKDLRCGITAKTINKVKPGTVFAFEPMLCHPFEAKRVRRWPVWGEIKRDGLRCVIKAIDGDMRFLSRAGREKFAQMPVLRVILTRLLEVSGLPELNFDCELTRGPNFNTSGSIKSYTDSLSDVNMHIFEAMTPREFDGLDVMPWKARQDRLTFWLSKLPNVYGHNYLLPEKDFGRILNTEEEVMAFFLEVRARDPREEGIIVKQMDGIYKPGRRHEWMKIKGCRDGDFRVVGWEPGTGKNSGSWGSLWLADGKGTRISKCGQGFSATDLARPYEHYHNRIVKVEYQDPTPDGSLRNAVFIEVRDDKDEADMVPAN